MAISLVGTTYDSVAGSRASASPALPASVQEGDVLILTAASFDGGLFNTPSGWTQILSIFRISSFYKIAGPSEAGPYTVSRVSGTSVISATISAYRGVDGTTPIGTSKGQNLATNASAQCLSITTETDGAWLLGSVTTSGNRSATAGSGQTELFDAQGQGTGGCTLATYYLEQAVAGASGNKTITLSGNATYGTHHFSLNAAASGGTHPLSGSSAGTSDGVGDRLVAEHVLGGSSVGTSDAVGDRLVASHALGGASLGESAGAATRLEVAHSLAGSSLGEGSAAGNLTLSGAGSQHPLSGSSVGASSAIADRVVVGHALGGQSVGASSASADRLMVEHALAAISLGVSEAGADRLVIEHPISAESIGSSSASGGLSLLAADRALIDAGRQVAAFAAARAGASINASRPGSSYSAPRQ